jgi:fumarylacetoacetase
MALGPKAWHGLRADLSRLLRAGAPEAGVLAACLLPQDQAEHALPARIGDHTDFFTSWQHMVNAGRILNADAPPLQNFSWLPIAYHGRASTVEVSGASFQRPMGITRPPGGQPVFGPTQGLDYEMELACWVGPVNPRGKPIAVDEAEDHIFGVGLLDDWSARDVQAFESMALGPWIFVEILADGPEVDGGYNLSNLTISAVPEPQSLAMMLAGIGALGFVAGQRRSIRA